MIKCLTLYQETRIAKCKHIIIEDNGNEEPQQQSEPEEFMG